MAGGVLIGAASAEQPESAISIGAVAGGFLVRAAFLLGVNGLGGAIDWVDGGDLAGTGLGIGVDLAALGADGCLVIAGLARMGGGLGPPAFPLALPLGGTGGMAAASPESSGVSWAAATGADSGATTPSPHFAFLGGGLGNPALSLLLRLGRIGKSSSSSNSGHGNLGSDDSSALADSETTRPAAHLAVLAACFLGAIVLTFALTFEPDTATDRHVMRKSTSLKSVTMKLTKIKHVESSLLEKVGSCMSWVADATTNSCYVSSYNNRCGVVGDGGYHRPGGATFPWPDPRLLR
jgi:hypothetical protein